METVVLFLLPANPCLRVRAIEKLLHLRYGAGARE